MEKEVYISRSDFIKLVNAIYNTIPIRDLSPQVYYFYDSIKKELYTDKEIQKFYEDIASTSNGISW